MCKQLKKKDKPMLKTFKIKTTTDNNTDEVVEVYAEDSLSAVNVVMHTNPHVVKAAAT